MDEICLKAYGKVNLALDITGRRQDGYHYVRLINQTVDIYDEVHVKKLPRGIVLTSDNPQIPSDKRNIAYKAADLMLDRYGVSGGVSINIKKNIPIGGGMAGGSTDAAAVINAVNLLYGLKLAEEEKDDIALKLGADVPFCLRKGLYLAEGIGERLTKLKPLQSLKVIICAPGFEVSTAWAYGEYDAVVTSGNVCIEQKPGGIAVRNSEGPSVLTNNICMKHKLHEQPGITGTDGCKNVPGYMRHPDIDGMLAAIEGGHQDVFIDKMGNALEKVVTKTYPDIEKIRQMLEESGACRAMMSGSGSTVFGIFTDEAASERAYEMLKGKAIKARIILTDMIPA